MEQIWMIVFMVIIGAFIGGLTNSLAIKMLFRPYEAKYIGKHRVPFTPGIIPKRRGQLAKQMGKLVVQHLVTEESIRRKLQENELQEMVHSKLIEEWSTLQSDERPLEEWLQSLEIDIEKQRVQTFVTKKGMQQWDRVIVKWGSKTVDESLGQVISEDEIIQLTQFAQKKLNDILSSEYTRYQLEQVIASYVESKGFLGNLLLSMMNKHELSIKIQRLLLNYLQGEEGYRLIHRNMKKEWDNVKEQELQQWLQYIQTDKVREKISFHIDQLLSIDKVLQLPVRQILTPFDTRMKEEWIPLFTRKAFAVLVQQIPHILKKLNIEKMVEAQVSTFPVQRMEEMILSISKKEFKWITYLGALLGAWIGLLQGLLILFTS